MPTDIITLQSYTHCIATIFSIDTIDGLGKSRLFLPVDRIEKIGLDRLIGSYIPHHHSGFLIMLSLIHI